VKAAFWWDYWINASRLHPTDAAKQHQSRLKAQAGQAVHQSAIPLNERCGDGWLARLDAVSADNWALAV
jgi:hypothetical protein